MTREETIKILSVLKGAYPQFYKGASKQDLEGTVSLWQSMFASDDYNLVAMAVKTIICATEREFPPNIGQIKAKMQKFQNPDEMTEAEAWNCVAKALRNGVYGAEEEYKKLPPVVQRLVGSPNQLREWSMMDAETVHSVVASNFQRSYKVRSASEREFLALPQDVKDFVQSLTSGMAMPMLEEGDENG